MNQTLIQAIEALGGLTSVAKLCGVRPPSVWEWKKRGRIPAERCPAIERATNGAVRCEDLRPDVDWSVLRGNPIIHDTEAEAA